MSLIQEALKRQQQEYGSGATPETPSSAVSEPPVTETMPVMEKPAPLGGTPPMVPPLPPPMPPPPPISVKASKPWMMIAGIAGVVLVVLMVAGFVAAKRMLGMAQEKIGLSRPSQSQPATLPRGSGTPVTKPVLAPKPGADGVAPQAESKPPAVSLPAPLVSAMPVAGEPALAAPQATEAAGRAEGNVPEKSAVQPAVVAPLQWPTLKLTGVLSSLSPGDGAARINNQMIFVGGQIDGVTLVEIRTDGVLLKYGEETKFLKMGGVLY